MVVPPNKWGPYFWGVIHLGCLTGSMKPEFIAMYPSVIPCGMCGQHFAELLAEYPFPDSQDPVVMFEWSVNAHNKVNEKIGKPIITAEEAFNIWTRPAPVFIKPKIDYETIVLVLALVLILLLIYFKA
jgi:hypothetical protein